MNNVLIRLAVLALCTGLAGCERSPERPEEPAVARPPSADAFCAAHGVLEAVCTKCHPKLIPIFQEKGDWCAEHGFPESFCPTCHPELGGRPAMSLAPESGAPAHGTKVQLDSPETAQLAGIETVEAREAGTSTELVVLGTIAYDAALRAEVNSRAAGVVRELLAEVGSHVVPGAALARIESAEVGAARSRLAAASSRVEVARAAEERVRGLSEQGLVARKTLLEAQLELDSALAEQAAAKATLEVIGAGETDGNVYTLEAPLGGTIVRRSATIGRMVGAGEVLYELVDTSSVWAELDVPESELGRVNPGLRVAVEADALPGETFDGRIDHIAPEIDPHTRTAKARVRLTNPNGRLFANMFVRGRVALELGARVLVPKGAVQRAKDVQLVFVELAPGRFEARRVRTAGEQGELVALLQGVNAGERVVTTGSFLLKTETLKGEIGAGCCDVE